MAYSSATVSRRGLTREVTLSAQATHQSEAVQNQRRRSQLLRRRHKPLSMRLYQPTKVTVAKRAATTIAKPVTKKVVKPKPFTGYKKGVFYQNGKRATGYRSDGKHRYLFRNGVKQKS